MPDKTFRIAIARTGNFTDSQGRPQSFSESDLDAIATSYNPKKLEAPLVFGHPTVSDPAFGWVKGLQREGNNLFAQLAQVPESVRQLVQNGRYKYVSMSLMPDRKTLRHVGLLGAAVPAIDGLGPISLAEGDVDSVTINFTAGGTMPTPEELQSAVTALEKEREALKRSLAESQQTAKQTSADFAAYKKGIETSAREKRMDELVKSGKVKPVDRASCLSFAASLSGLTDTFDFAASDGNVEKLSAKDVFRVIMDMAQGYLSTADMKPIRVELIAGAITIGGYIIHNLNETYPDPVSGDWVRKIPAKMLMAVATDTPGTIWYCALDSISANNAALPLHIVPMQAQDDSGYTLVAQSKPVPGRSPKTVCLCMAVA